MINWQPLNLKNELITLVPMQEQHRETLYLTASDPKIWEQHPQHDRWQREIFDPYFDQGLQSGSGFIITDTANELIIGTTRYYDITDHSVAIGYTFLTRPYWGGKHNMACKSLLLDYAFGYVDKVYLHIGPDNMRSIRGTAKLGASFVNSIPQVVNGQEVLRNEYVIEKQVWNNMKKPY
jgi:RimJ/RimL family protein N-acetyltransferase